MNIELVDDPELIAMMGFGDQSGTRSKGLHLSDITRALLQRLEKDKTKKKYANFDPDAPLPARVEFGILWEPVLEEALKRKYSTIRPAEIVSPEGIAMSPDGVNPTDICGEEFKASWKSCRDGIVDEYGMPREKFQSWFWQMKSYAKWLDVNDYLLRVFFVNGNYNKSGKLADGSDDPDAGPVFKTYRLWFSQEEIDENWQMILTVAREEGML